MDKKESKRRARQYAEVVIDFANAGTTDRALSKFFENIQRAFGFSPTFVNEAKKYSPSLQEIGSKSVEGLVKRCPEEIARRAYTIRAYSNGSRKFSETIKDSPAEIADLFTWYVEELHDATRVTQKDLRRLLKDIVKRKKLEE